MVEPGDNLVILTGAPIVEKGHTSLMKLHKVGSACGPIRLKVEELSTFNFQLLTQWPYSAIK